MGFPSTTRDGETPKSTLVDSIVTLGEGEGEGEAPISTTVTPSSTPHPSTRPPDHRPWLRPVRNGLYPRRHRRRAAHQPETVRDKLFVTGAGAIGCEILKNLAAMGGEGRVRLADGHGHDRTVEYEPPAAVSGRRRGGVQERRAAKDLLQGLFVGRVQRVNAEIRSRTGAATPCLERAGGDLFSWPSAVPDHRRAYVVTLEEVEGRTARAAEGRAGWRCLPLDKG